MQFGARDRSCRKHVASNCIMTTPHAHPSQMIESFLSKHDIPQVRQAPYSPDMAPYDFWLFPRLKTLKAPVLTAARTLYRTRRRSCTPFQIKPSRSAFSDGRIAGLSVWNHKGPTLKGIRYCNHPDTELCFPGLRMDTFWIGLLYTTVLK
jgi:hypothetical protein